MDSGSHGKRTTSDLGDLRSAGYVVCVIIDADLFMRFCEVDL